MIKAFALLATLIGIGFSSAAFAQDGCQTVRSSCSQMMKTCESRCQGSPRCLPGCLTGLEVCKQTGVWKASTSPACWRTTNRS